MAKLPYRWSSELPSKAGFWWYRASPDVDGKIVRVYLDAQREWSVQYNNLDCEPDEEDSQCDFLLNWIDQDKDVDERPQWCHIPEPGKPRK